MTSEEQSKSMEVLVKNQAVQLQVVKENDVYKNFKPPDLPVVFGSLFNNSLVGKSYTEVMEECERILESQLLRVTEEQSHNVNKVTIGQSKTQLWNVHRAGHCTAFNTYSISRANLDIPALWLLKKCCHPVEKPFSTEATRYGIENKGRCIRNGCQLIAKKGLHGKFTVSRCGFIISIHWPEVVASPDASFHSELFGDGVIEAKCSWTHRYAKSLKEVCLTNKVFFLKYDEKT